MRTGAWPCAFLALLALAGCSTPQEHPPDSQRETERAPGALPDAYKHPPK